MVTGKILSDPGILKPFFKIESFAAFSPGFYFICAIFFFSCKPENTPVSNLNENKIAVVGHGGSGINTWRNFLPMNSFESIRNATENQHADGVEMDIQLTADDKLMLFHDALLEQVANCSGLVHSHSEKELLACSYSFLLGLEKYPLVSLEHILQHFTKAAKPPLLTFDIKLHPSPSINGNEYQKRFAKAVVESSRNYCCPEKILIESTSKEFLLELKALEPALQLFIYTSDFESGLAAAKEAGLFGITIKNDFVTREQVSLAHQNGFRVAIWGTKTKSDNKKAMNKTPDYIQTDNINSLSSLLN